MVERDTVRDSERQRDKGIYWIGGRTSSRRRRRRPGGTGTSACRVTRQGPTRNRHRSARVACEGCRFADLPICRSIAKRLREDWGGEGGGRERLDGRRCSTRSITTGRASTRASWTRTTTTTPLKWSCRGGYMRIYNNINHVKYVNYIYVIHVRHDSDDFTLQWHAPCVFVQNKQIAPCVFVQNKQISLSLPPTPFLFLPLSLLSLSLSLSLSLFLSLSLSFVLSLSQSGEGEGGKGRGHHPAARLGQPRRAGECMENI
jgi:hypothetical protein